MGIGPPELTVRFRSVTLAHRRHQENPERDGDLIRICSGHLGTNTEDIAYRPGNTQLGVMLSTELLGIGYLSCKVSGNTPKAGQSTEGGEDRRIEAS